VARETKYKLWKTLLGIGSHSNVILTQKEDVFYPFAELILRGCFESECKVHDDDYAIKHLKLLAVTVIQKIVSQNINIVS
jgi:2-hydroxychromene-2-carboxylate isomerase